MVLVHLKQPDGDEFYFEAPAENLIENVATDLATVHNMRLKLNVLVQCVRELAKYGPMKPEAERGLAESQLESDESSVDPRLDPNGIRVGEPPAPEACQTLLRTASDAEEKISKQQFLMKVVSTQAALQESFDMIRGAVMIAYPMGLPEWDVVRTIIEDTETFAGHALSKDLLEPKTCQLWWAGKLLARDQPLSKYVGRNDKTKIVAKLARKGSGAPQREPGVDAETQKNMMAFYHKKQQELEKLEVDNADSHYNSEWANPRGLKSQFTGVGDIKWRPGR